MITGTAAEQRQSLPSAQPQTSPSLRPQSMSKASLLILLQMSALSVSEVDPCKEQLLNTLLMSETLVAKNEEHSVNNVEVSNVESIT